MDTEDYVILRYNSTLSKWEVIGGVWPIAWVLNVPVGDGSSNIGTGVVDYYELPFNGIMTFFRFVSEDAGVTIQMDVWKDTYANWPPVVGNTIFSGNKPVLSTSQKDEDTTLAVVITKGDYLGVNVDSNTDAQRVTLSMGGYRKRG